MRRVAITLALVGGAFVAAWAAETAVQWGLTVGTEPRSLVVYDTSGTPVSIGSINSSTHLYSPIPTAAVPIGTVVDYSGSAAPALWLLAAGQAVSRTTYAGYFAVVGTTYGAGNGVTTFNVPDLRGRVSAGTDNMGGVAANRLTSAGSGINGVALGAAGGAETHTLVTAEVPNLTLSASGSTGGNVTGSITALSLQTRSTLGGNLDALAATGPGGVSDATTMLVNGSVAVPLGAGSASVTGSTTNGGGGAHSVTQPTFILNKIIYVGV